MINIAFHSNQLCLRGTEIALYDYAKHNEDLLGNKSIIIAKNPNIWKYSHPKAIEKFKNRFNVYFYDDFNEVDKILDDNNIDVFYAIKAGMNDGVCSKRRKSVMHSVFQYYEPHGNVYAYVSEWLGKKYNSPFVPHMIDLPEVNGDLRIELNIPKDAIVFGRYGGAETFNMKYVHQAIIDVCSKRKDIYFVFMFTNRFSDESIKNIVYLDGSEDINRKVMFINTCDAMIHGRTGGESFGLAIGEFSVRNKPIITWNGGVDQAHIDMLKNNAYYYNNQLELSEIFNNFVPSPEKDWNMYKKYNPKDVMEIFHKVFIE